MDLVCSYHATKVKNEIDTASCDPLMCYCKPPIEWERKVCQRPGPHLGDSYRVCTLGEGKAGCGFFKWDPKSEATKDAKILELEKQLKELKERVEAQSKSE